MPPTPTALAWRLAATGERRPCGWAIPFGDEAGAGPGLCRPERQGWSVLPPSGHRGHRDASLTGDRLTGKNLALKPTQLELGYFGRNLIEGDDFFFCVKRHHLQTEALPFLCREKCWWPTKPTNQPANQVPSGTTLPFKGSWYLLGLGGWSDPPAAKGCSPRAQPCDTFLKSNPGAGVRGGTPIYFGPGCCKPALNQRPKTKKNTNETRRWANLSRAS